MRFEGSQHYVATDDLKLAVNAAVTLQRPLLLKGEPGTGKTMLAEEVAAALGLPLLAMAHQVDDQGAAGPLRVRRRGALRDSQLGDPGSSDIENYIKQGQALAGLRGRAPVALLIDEIDKADIEFPNDLLRELDRMEFYVYETGQTIARRQRPLVFITSQQREGAARRLPAPLLLPLHPLPRRETMERIVDVHFPNLKQRPAAGGDGLFYEIREVPG
jgi:MoxR-like ATPase